MKGRISDGRSPPEPIELSICAPVIVLISISVSSLGVFAGSVHKDSFVSG